jgi:hypothetical protein
MRLCKRTLQAVVGQKIRRCLEVDLYAIEPPCVGPPPREYADGSRIGIWSVRRHPVPNEYGETDEPVDSPYASWTTLEDVVASMAESRMV